jgi:hypothetical protein
MPALNYREYLNALICSIVSPNLTCSALMYVTHVHHNYAFRRGQQVAMQDFNQQMKEIAGKLASYQVGGIIHARLTSTLIVMCLHF